MIQPPAPDPTRRLAPVVRVAPAKLNLTLAVVGRRPDGFHVLHSVFVPLGLADRLSLSYAAVGPDTLQVSGFDAGPPADNLVLRAIAATRIAVGGGWPGGPEPGPVAGGAAREADPGGRRSGRWLVGRGRRAGRLARGVDCRAGPRRPARDRGTARVGRPVLPGGRSGARRGPRRDGYAAPRPPGQSGRAPGDAGHSRFDAGGLRRLRRAAEDGATAPRGCRRRISPKSSAPV